MATARCEARSLCVEPYSADPVVKRHVSLNAYHMLARQLTTGCCAKTPCSASERRPAG